LSQDGIGPEARRQGCSLQPKPKTVVGRAQRQIPACGIRCLAGLSPRMTRQMRVWWLPISGCRRGWRSLSANAAGTVCVSVCSSEEAAVCIERERERERERPEVYTQTHIHTHTHTHTHLHASNYSTILTIDAAWVDVYVCVCVVCVCACVSQCVWKSCCHPRATSGCRG